MATPAGRLPPANQTGGTERQGDSVTEPGAAGRNRTAVSRRRRHGCPRFTGPRTPPGAASLPAVEAVRDDKARRDLERLAERLDRLEAALFRLVSLTAGGLLVAGLLLPYAAFAEEGEQYEVSLLTIGFTAGRADAFFAVTFLGLLLAARTSSSDLPGRDGHRIRPTMPVS